MWAKVNQRIANKQYEREKKPHKSSSSSQKESEQDQQLHQSEKKGKYSYSDSQSEEDESEKSLGNNRQRHNSGSSSSSQEESEEDSLEEQAKNKARKLQSLRQESDQQQEESIDYIEQRIKKLEKDLEQRLDKHKAKPNEKIIQKDHKKNSSHQHSQESGRIVSMRKQPPIPPKKRQIAEEDNTASLPQTQINFKTREKPSSREEKSLENDAQNKKQTPSQIVINKKKLVKENSQDLGNLPSKKSGSSSVQSPIKASKKRIKSSNIVYQKSQPQLALKPTTTIEKDLKKLNKEISELKKQNKNLKDELSYYKKKKRPAEEVQKLRELSEHDTKKLEKELQLLKVLQRLQNKLKNSIERKLGKGSSENKMTKQTALLHKGLPSNILR